MNVTNQFRKSLQAFCFVVVTMLAGLSPVFAQVGNVDLDQNISIYSDNEPLADVIKKICAYLKLDYSYNSKLVEGKNISLNISNKPVKYVIDKLMKDFYLIFEVEDNIMIVREYVPLNESMDMERARELGAARGFMFENSREKSITLPFKTASNLIILPLTINDSDTLNFILDTGVATPIITELTFVDKLNLNYLVPIELRGVSNTETVSAYRSSNNIIRTKGMVAQSQDIHMIIDDQFQLSHILGIPVHGLVGLNLFKDYVVKIDYPRERITLYRHEYFRHRTQKKDILLPLYFEAGKPFVNTNIKMEGDVDVPVKLLVDTGASDALWLSEKSDERITLPSRHVETFLGTSLTGDLYGTKGRIDAVWVGPLVLPNPIVSFPDNEMLDQLLSLSNRNGTLGAEILRRFIVTFDYRNARLTLSPTSLINDDFNYNMSGMEIINPMPGFPIYTISNIREGSPAYLAGLREDDQIISVNSNSHKSLSLNDINLMMQSRENKKIKMKVLRDGREFTTAFALKSLF